MESVGLNMDNHLESKGQVDMRLTGISYIIKLGGSETMRYGIKNGQGKGRGMPGGGRRNINRGGCKLGGPGFGRGGGRGKGKGRLG